MTSEILPRPSVRRILHQIPVLRLLADVLFLVVAMAPGGVEGNAGCAAGALVALVFLGNRLDGFGQWFCHRWSPLGTERNRRWRWLRSRERARAPRGLARVE